MKKALLLTAGSVLVYTTLSAVSASAQSLSKNQKSLNAQIQENEQALKKARLEREEITQKLEGEKHHLEEMIAHNLLLEKNKNLNQKQLLKLQQNLLQKKIEQHQLENKQQNLLLEERKLEEVQILWELAHPKYYGLNTFLYEMMPPYKKNNNATILPLFFTLLAQENEEKKEKITSNTEALAKEKRVLANKTENLREQQKLWIEKEKQISQKLEEIQKRAEAQNKSILEHDAEIKKRKEMKDELGKKLADLISEEDLQQRIEQQKERTERKIQIQQGEKPKTPAPIKIRKLQLGDGISPLPSRPTAQWGQMEDGIANDTIKYPGHANENVVSPVHAIVLFAGNFEGFGQVVILDCGPKTRMVLAGLGKISVKKGDQVQKRQSIGQMPSNTTSTLSLQLRIKNIPVNPAKYLKN
ncbi:hypothetical protein FAI41_02480 [Acetobacteraceae bacterium]|nr:hypothetical protein FAI41_02480 [Acetobacteraceae bacterium]